MKKLDPTDLKPCPHMRSLVSAKVDGHLHGLAAWYTDFHVAGCKQCQASIPFLTSLKERLAALNRDVKDIADATRETIHRELEKVDKTVVVD
jgi:hypothetical protein